MSAARAGLIAHVVNRKFIRPSVFTKNGKTIDPARRLRFFMPFMWGTCIGVFVGAIILAGGAAMSTVGYYADHYATTNTTNGTHITASSKNRSMYYHLTNLTFVGPIFMGIGCFVIVVACVVVLETRDKMVKDLLNNLAKPVPKKHTFYDKIIHQMKHSETQALNDSLSNGFDNSGFELGEEANSGALSPTDQRVRLGPRYSNRSVKSALKRIPMDIFAINIDNDPEIPSLLPVWERDPVPKTKSLPALERIYPQRPSILNTVFHQRSSTPDPERRVPVPTQGDARATGVLDLSSSFPVPDRLQTLYPDDIESSSFMWLHEDGDHGGITSSAMVSAPGGAGTHVNDGRPRAEVDPDRRSVKVLVHRASLSRGGSDCSLPSSKEDQVVECFFESDSSTMGDVTPRPPRRSPRRLARGGRPPLVKADSRATLSAVHATIGGHPSAAESSNSDDDSLHLTDDMMRNFDLSLAGTTDPSYAGTAEISIASATTANTLDSHNTHDLSTTHQARSADQSMADTVEVSFTSVSTADLLETTGSSRPTTPEVPLGATMNTRRRGTATVNQSRLDS